MRETALILRVAIVPFSELIDRVRGKELRGRPLGGRLSPTLATSLLFIRLSTVAMFVDVSIRDSPGDIGSERERLS